ncbi:hypothetical protein LTS10_013330 [Elasticomyces elasticus]|nr:hypothetical protein LTS10_013330 [Elasticomyces elasticus]
MSPHTTKHLELDDESSEESFGTDSDLETTSPINDSSIREHWLGEKYFKFALATGLTRDTSLGQGPVELESKLYLAMTTFDYNGRLYSLRNQAPRRLWRDGTNDRDEFLTTIGAVLRVGQGSLEESVLQSLCQYGDKEQVQSPDVARRAKPDIRSDEVDRAPSGRDVQVLKEHADSVGTPYEHQERGVPNGFLATIEFGGRTYTSEGRSKKVAHQCAARTACAALRLGGR